MEIKVRGLKEIEAQLVKLGSKEGTKVLRAAMLRATKPIEDQAKSNAATIEEGSGSLERSIGRRFVVGTRSSLLAFLPDLGGRFSVIITPIRKSRVAIALHNLFYRRKVKGIFHGHFVEFGTERSRRQPFLRPALDTRGTQAVQSLAAEIKQGIERLLSKRQ